MNSTNNTSPNASDIHLSDSLAYGLIFTSCILGIAFSVYNWWEVTFLYNRSQV